MARARRPRTAAVPPSIPEPPPPPIDPGLPPPGGPSAETTGRYIIVFRDEVVESPNKGLQALNRVAGIRNVASAAEYTDAAVDPDEVQDADALYLPALGLAVVSADDTRLQALMSEASDEDSNILAIEPEYVYHALADLSGLPLEYLRGYRDAINHLYDQLTGTGAVEGEEALIAFQDTAQFTWGLQATRVNTSRFSGQGVRVAVLDTGLDLQHPDVRGRRIVNQSFIPGQTAQDGQGHGTHCTGTAAGPQAPATGVRRYGVAFGAEIFIGKVLSNAGSSVGSSVLSGMNWAVTNRCQVISMSLGANVNQVSQAFEQAGQRALQAGCLIIAAAGNNADRAAGNFGFVGQPANSPSIMAVAAVDSRLRIANFSARSSSVTGVGGRVDIAAPGVAVFSSWPRPQLHNTISGTSMATPHVAGIAAQWSQATQRTGHALLTTLLQNARRITGDVRDIGSGLAQAPQ